VTGREAQIGTAFTSGVVVGRVARIGTAFAEAAPVGQVVGAVGARRGNSSHRSVNSPAFEVGAAIGQVVGAVSLRRGAGLPALAEAALSGRVVASRRGADSAAFAGGAS